MNLIFAQEQKQIGAAEGGVTRDAASVAQSSKAEIGPSSESGSDVNRKDLVEETRQSMSQCSDRWKVVDDLEEGDAMDRYEDGEMMRQWEDVSQEEGKITLKRNEGKLMVSQAQMRKQ